MSAIPPAVSSVLNARADATNQKVQIELLSKQLDAQKQTGDAINNLLEQAKQVQAQIQDGHIDVRI
ncbi:hypothetical protein CA13_56440 [Planctomycetes bacterium CA13]|uniref:Uncharacterized protein n=1 Tax=Novipirellula herctigrandis TaxID=2527986 RepID=A0A5C5ZAD3_9BACT|nr:hypothetical protein CA13_56440 [Planctomycetes bacterium CA13]